MTLPIVRTVADLRATVAGWRHDGLRTALVPTMGALHEGHLTLVREALKRADRVCVSLFVNPKQFGPREDFSTYPRQESQDAAMLAGAGAHLLYAPEVDTVYPPGFATKVSVGGVSEPMEGSFRPGFFDGVATVVAKLLLRALPDVALFGEKDYQQLQVVTRMAADLDIPSEIVGIPTVREADGLALSSRNAYLTPEERAVAPTLHQVLSRIAAAVGKPTAPLAEAAAAELLAAGFSKVDYIDVRDSSTLDALDTVRPGARVLAAAWLGRARLIDNLAVA